MASIEKQPLQVRIQRFNPDSDKKPTLKQYEVALSDGKTVLDAMQEIKDDQDSSLTFRRSCRHAICGSCAANVNGSNRLVCTTPLKDVVDRKGRVTIRPLPYQPIIKDLVVDRTAFWEQYLRVKPWLVPPDDVPEKEFRISPEEVEALRHAETCIMCGACYASCPVVGMNKKYMGPHALLKAFLRVLDPRDTIPAERLETVGTDEGVYRCHTVFNCIDACPKGLDPAKAIVVLRQLAIKRQAIEDSRKKRQKTLDQPISEKVEP